MEPDIGRERNLLLVETFLAQAMLLAHGIDQFHKQGNLL